MIIHKSGFEIEQIRLAGQAVAQAHRLAAKMINPGVRTGDISRAVYQLLKERGATPVVITLPGLMTESTAICISINEEAVHGIPGERCLKDGDLVSLDVACRLNGWCADAAWSYPVGQVDRLKRELLQAGERALMRAIECMRTCQWWSDVVRSMNTEVHRWGFRVVGDLPGHGIGRELHEDPQVPHVWSERLERVDFQLKPGLVIAVEPVIAAGTDRVRFGLNRWTMITADSQPSVHFEHTVAIDRQGVHILTSGLAD